MADRIGQQLGNYHLIGLLGSGGFAEVYLGEHIHLGTQAAIKVLYTQLGQSDIEQFRNEARTIAHLEHPHIVRVLDFGVDGMTPFLVMSYAPHGTLRTRHPKGTRLPLATVASYVEQVASALQYAHDHKLVHRDIKPENLLVGRSDEILLSDFGIALITQSSRYQSTRDMAGTITYMAPEQINTHPRPASDQYSLGIVVYEWLSGDRPFHGSFTEIAIKHSVVPPPSLLERVPTLSPAVEQVVMRALAKDPKQRFDDIQTFADALRNNVPLSPSRGPISPTIKAPIVAPPTPSEPVPQAPAGPKPEALVRDLTDTPSGTDTTQQKVPTSYDSPTYGVLDKNPYGPPNPYGGVPLTPPPPPSHRVRSSLIVRIVSGVVVSVLILGVVGTFTLLTLRRGSNPAQDCGETFSDEFNGTLNSRWNWVNPSANATYSMATNGFLSITTPPQSDLNPVNNFNAPRLLQPISGDFTVETLVRFSPVAFFQSAGILIWQNQTKFLRFELSYPGSNDLSFHEDENGLFSGNLGLYHNLPGGQTALRMQRKGDHFTASWRESSSQLWQIDGETDIHLDSPMVGLDLLATYNAPQTTAYYDYFRVSCA